MHEDFIMPSRGIAIFIHPSNLEIYFVMDRKPVEFSKNIA